MFVLSKILFNVCSFLFFFMHFDCICNDFIIRMDLSNMTYCMKNNRKGNINRGTFLCVSQISSIFVWCYILVPIYPDYVKNIHKKELKTKHNNKQWTDTLKPLNKDPYDEYNLKKSKAESVLQFEHRFIFNSIKWVYF